MPIFRDCSQPEEFVFHELLSDLVHIDVNIMRPDETHPYYVMYTTGMSDMPMTLPEEIQDREDLRYGELYMFLPKEWNPGEAGQINSDIAQEEYWPIGLIKYLARFPMSTAPGWDGGTPFPMVLIMSLWRRIPEWAAWSWYRPAAIWAAWRQRTAGR